MTAVPSDPAAPPTLPAFDPGRAASYRDTGLWGSRTIAGELTEVARHHPDREAVVAEQGRLTYAELDALTDRTAVGLLDLGLPVGGRVICQVTNRLESVVAWYSLLKAGLVPVATLSAHRGHEIGVISRQAEAVAHLVEREPSHERSDKDCPYETTTPS